MARPGHIARLPAGMSSQSAGHLNEREQHVLRERLVERAAAQIPDNGLGGPFYRMVLCFAMAVAFGAGVWRAAEEQVAYEFYAAWLLEIALSAENLFAIFMIFQYFKVPLMYQEYVLWWGLIGAVVMRGVMIFAGGIAILLLKELMLAYSAVIIYSGLRLVTAPPMKAQTQEDISNNAVVRFVQFILPVTDYYDGQKFLSTKADGSLAATPLFVVLLSVELTDFIFAIDNVPALFSVAERGDVFIVSAATFFGILGLRASYTLLTRALPQLPYLQKGTGAVLVFVGLRAMADYFGMRLPSGMSLLAIIVVLAGSAAVSVWSAEWAATPSTEKYYPDMESQAPSNLAAPAAQQQNMAPFTGAHDAAVYGPPGSGGRAPAQSSAPGKGRSVAADLIGSALGEPPSANAAALSFKMTAQD